MKRKEIKAALNREWGEGYKWKIIEIIKRDYCNLTMVIYRVKCIRDGSVEYRCKNMSGNHRWDYATKIDF